MTLQIITLSLLFVACALILVLVFKKPKSTSDETIKNGFSNQAEMYQQINKLMLDNIKSYNDSVIKTISQQSYLQKQESIYPVI